MPPRKPVTTKGAKKAKTAAAAKKPAKKKKVLKRAMAKLLDGASGVGEKMLGAAKTMGQLALGAFGGGASRPVADTAKAPPKKRKPRRASKRS